MKTNLLLAAAMIFGFSSIAGAGTTVGAKDGGASDGGRPVRIDHPLAQPVANQDVGIEITHDDVLRSCCAPPNLVVSGKVHNLTPHPIDYVRLAIVMKDAGGHVVHNEDTYNHGAVTLFEDPEIAKLLNETQHADPLAPGASDTFVFVIPMPLLPRYKSVAVSAADVVRESPIAKSH